MFRPQHVEYDLNNTFSSLLKPAAIMGPNVGQQFNVPFVASSFDTVAYLDFLTCTAVGIVYSWRHMA